MKRWMQLHESPDVNLMGTQGCCPLDGRIRNPNVIHRAAQKFARYTNGRAKGYRILSGLNLLDAREGEYFEL